MANVNTATYATVNFEQTATKQVRYRIGTVQAFCMLLVALFFDIVQLLLTITIIGALATWIFGVIAWCIFTLWFLLNRVAFWDHGGKKALTALFGIVLESLPFTGGLPLLTVSVMIVIWLSHREDKKGSVTL